MKTYSLNIILHNTTRNNSIKYTTSHNQKRLWFFIAPTTSTCHCTIAIRGSPEKQLIIDNKQLSIAAHTKYTSTRAKHTSGLHSTSCLVQIAPALVQKTIILVQNTRVDCTAPAASYNLYEHYCKKL